MKSTQNQRGSTLVWAITIIMVMMIIITAMLSISQQYYARSQQNFKIKQSQITAASAGDVLTKMIETDYENIGDDLIPQAYNDSEEATIRVHNISLGDKMGSANAIIHRFDENILIISIKAEYKEIQSQLKIKMIYQNVNEGGQAWTRVKDDNTQEVKP